MIIIVEGVDFSGKTTLISQLADDLNAWVLKAFSKPRDLVDAQEWVTKVTAGGTRPVICDRTPLISEPIYGNIIRGYSTIRENDAQSLLKALPNAVLVICDPGWEHIQTCNNEQMDGVKENLQELWRAYSHGYRKGYPIPYTTYNFLDPEEYGRLRSWLQSFAINRRGGDPNTGMVKDFHLKFGVPMPTNTTLMDDHTFQFRLKFMQEELNEFASAHVHGDLVKAFDALLDLEYVLKGTALMMGITPEQYLQGFLAVQRANMTKIRTPSASQSKRGSSLDVIKPEGWVGPEVHLRRIISE